MSGAGRRERQERSFEPAAPRASAPNTGLRTRLVMLGMAAVFASVAGQLPPLAGTGRGDMVATLTEPIARSYVRPDILDRGGRLLATDLEMPSLYADPSLVQGIDEVAERLGAVLPDLDQRELRRQLSDRNRRFIWLRR